MTDDLRARIRRALAEADGFDYDHLEPHDYQKHADAILAIVQPITDELAENEGVLTSDSHGADRLRYYAAIGFPVQSIDGTIELSVEQLRFAAGLADGGTKPSVINEMTGSYLVGLQVASAALYNTVLRRAMRAEAERDGHREVQRTEAEQAFTRIRALHHPYRSVHDDGDNQSCSHCDQLTGTVVPWPCDTIRSLNGQP